MEPESKIGHKEIKKKTAGKGKDGRVTVEWMEPFPVLTCCRWGNYFTRFREDGGVKFLKFSEHRLSAQPDKRTIATWWVMSARNCCYCTELWRIMEVDFFFTTLPTCVAKKSVRAGVSGLSCNHLVTPRHITSVVLNTFFSSEFSLLNL